PGRPLQRTDSERRTAGRPASPTSDQGRAGDQPRHREDAGCRGAGDVARPRRRGDRMNRRAFIAGLAGAVGSPIPLRAQQQMPLIGFLHPASPDGFADRLRGFREGLKEAGYVEGENVAIEYRWADNQIDRLPALAADLVRRRVAVIAGTGSSSVLKAATSTIPIVFITAQDPVALGFVASLARPGGNLTGVNFFGTEVGTKRLDLLRELVPEAARVAVLVDPASAAISESTSRDVEAAARAKGLQVRLLSAGTSGEIDTAFASLARERPDALFVGVSAFFTDRRVQLALLAMLHRIPTAYPFRDFAEAGGLMSYGASLK